MQLEKAIFSIKNQQDFKQTALEVFQFQYQNNTVYNKFCSLINRHPNTVKELEDIPFLPISFFKSHSIKTTSFSPEIVFTSSGTTGSTPSRHPVKKLSLYQQSFINCFTESYGAIKDYVVLALLPSYLERKGSSLVTMADYFIKESKHPESGFYLNELEQLGKFLEKLDKTGKKILLIGVSFALLDLIEQKKFRLKNTIVMETGGMKGRRKEIIRKELHEILKNGFGVSKIHSEYGMTELFSQAYSKGDGIFECPKHMQFLIRDPEDALSLLPENKTGGINVVDLANLYSCAFIATQDLGKKTGTNQYEILGRFDNSDVRGCNLMAL
ncbi:LuxE/PaaK family acyltransferase [Haloflavibacter putidus]|uniref:Acyl transferase n=1 Tax=Haloflavibacter putidus TaxID=2576776 RepID=A0A507ZM46_9FLAO|nr:acyl transferase [Haloflavibacter putidus]TQD38570.1 acyl transferase [Haloflavibacter putidus]